MLLLCAPGLALAKNPNAAGPPGQAPGAQAQAAPFVPPGQAKKAPAAAAPAPAPPGQAKKGGPRSSPPGRANQAPTTFAPASSAPAGGSAPPGQVKNAGTSVPPGQAKKAAGSVPPGQAKKVAATALPPGQAKKVTGVAPPGQLKKGTAAITSTSGAVPASAARAVPNASSRAAANRIATQRAAAARARAVAARQARAALRRARAAALRRARAIALRSATAATGAFAGATAVGAATTGPGVATAAATGATAGTPAHRTSGSGTPRKPAADRSPVNVVTRTVTRTVRDIAHVIPGWVKALLAALAVLLAVAAGLILAAALRNRRLRAQRAALIADVGALQAALLPIVPEKVGALGVSVAYRPAQGLAAGGDFYDVFPLDHDRVGILVGDVSGHGRESLRSATFTRHMVRSYLEAGLGPRTALQLAGTVVDQHNRDDDFATLIAAIHDPTAGTLSYASAGHPPPIVIGPAAHEPLTVASSPPLGVGSPTGLRQTTLPLPPGSAFCLYTDGLVEARRGGVILGRRRLEAIVNELGPEASASALIDRVARESDILRDDVAVCMVRVDPNAAASGTVRVEELEVDASDLNRRRVRRFLQGCGVAPDEIDEVIRAARRRTAIEGSVVLRVRLADDRSGVDVLPTASGATGAAVATLAPIRAIEK